MFQITTLNRLACFGFYLYNDIYCSQAGTYSNMLMAPTCMARKLGTVSTIGTTGEADMDTLQVLQAALGESFGFCGNFNLLNNLVLIFSH